MKVAKYDVPQEFSNSAWVKNEYTKHNEFADKVNSDDESYPDFCHNCLCDSWFSSDHTCMYCGQ